MARKKAIILDEPTLKLIRGLGSIHATHKEVAAVLGVHLNTWMYFKRDNPEAQEAFEDGQEEGKSSLRRDQFNLAKRNATMAIFLGKQYLGQRDIQYTRDAEFGDMSDEELDSFIDDGIRDRQRRLEVGEGDKGTQGKAAQAHGGSTRH